VFCKHDLECLSFGSVAVIIDRTGSRPVLPNRVRVYRGRKTTMSILQVQKKRKRHPLHLDAKCPLRRSERGLGREGCRRKPRDVEACKAEGGGPHVIYSTPLADSPRGPHSRPSTPAAPRARLGPARGCGSLVERATSRLLMGT
jgi:hypothetical protein